MKFVKLMWGFIVTLFIVAFILAFQFFVPYTAKVGPLFKSKVKFVMKSEKIKKVVLDNGLTVLVFQNESTPKVLVQLAYDVGSWVEEAGERGLAHLIEHMIFKGTDKLSESDIDSIARKYGASFNAFTANDMTSYYFETNKNNWQPFVSLLAECMQSARFDEEHLASEFKAVIQELKMYKDRYWSVMLEKAGELVFPSNHPYHFPIIGFKEDLVNIKAQDLKDFYKKYYQPERATLFIVGDVDIDEAVKVAKENFEKIKIESEKKEIVSKEKFPTIGGSLVAHKTRIYEDVKKEQLGFYWLIPGLKAKNDVLISVLDFVLGQGEGSRLHTRLVDEEKVATGIAVFGHQLMEAGLFLILLEPVDGKIEQCRKIIEEELIKIVKDGVSSEELNKVVRAKGREFFDGLQSLQDFTYEWIKSYFSTNDEFDIFQKVNEFNNINSEQIQSFVGDYLDPLFMNQIELIPLPKEKSAILQKMKAESDKLDMAILKTHVRIAPVEEPKFVKNMPAPHKLDFNFPRPSKDFVLDNGLQVLLHQNSQWPILSLNCRFKDASYFSDAKEGLLIDLMMNALIEESSKYSKKENVNFFDGYGAEYSFNASGGALSLLKEDVKTVFDRFFYILNNPTFPKDAVEKLKNIYIDLFQRTKDSPSDVATRILKNLIYKNHSFDWTFDQAIEMLKKVTVDDLKQLHKKYVTAENMILTIVGDLDLDQMQKTTTDVFGGWQKGEYKKIDYPKSEFVPDQKVNEFMMRDQVILAMGQPSSINIYDPDLIPIKILNFISFDSMGSRLYKLREQTGLFYNAGGMFAAGATKEHGFDFLKAILSLEKVDDAEKGIREVVKNVAQNGVHEDEVDAARQLYLKGLIDLTSSNDAVAVMLNRLASFDLGFDYYDKVLKRVQTIEVKELNEIAKKYFSTDKMAVVRVGRV